MYSRDSMIKRYYNEHGELEGVFILSPLWLTIENSINPILERGLAELNPKQKKEPLGDWEELLKHWDFKYPVDLDVVCGNCHSRTANWSTDVPRKFFLTAVNLGGLVAFQCLECKAKIVKKHFKKHIDVKTIPFNSPEGKSA
jgi:hypothetical protein